MPCNLVKRYQRFGVTRYLQLHSITFKISRHRWKDNIKIILKTNSGKVWTEWDDSASWSSSRHNFHATESRNLRTGAGFTVVENQNVEAPTSNNKFKLQFFFIIIIIIIPYNKKTKNNISWFQRSRCLNKTRGVYFCFFFGGGGTVLVAPP
jgi:hypothetical protein